MAMLSGLAGKAGVNHVIPAELGANTGAARYASIVTPALPFDMVLLGLGEDGHTASLFPGQDFQQSAMVIPVHEAPKPPPDRISLTPRALQSCHEMLVIVTGSGKAQALSRWRSGENLPIAAVTSGAANVTVVVDRDAAG
jgi:6-phosphogluconolactonase